MFFFFFFNDTATTEIYTLSLHDALPISLRGRADTSGQTKFIGRERNQAQLNPEISVTGDVRASAQRDRKSTRLNSSHVRISYAVFCLKKKNNLHSACLESSRHVYPQHLT